MKKIILISLTVIAFIAISCTEDYSDPKVLSGTTWRCSSFPVIDGSNNLYDYAELQFISTTQVQAWEKPKDGPLFKSGSASYMISNKTITFFDPESDENISITGVIDNKKITILNNGYSFIYIKQ